MRFLAAVTLVLGFACAHEEIDVEEVAYTDTYDNDYPLLGFVSIPENTPAPAVVIIHDITGPDDYEKIRATMLQHDLGYVGFAADIFGAEFAGEDNSTLLREQADLYRGNNSLFFSRIQAAVDLLKGHPDVIPEKIAVIGYCFGGTGILTYSFLGATDVVGAVSFHGGLTDFPVETAINHPVLVLSGGADDTGTEVEDLENSLNLANATWQITRYSGIDHAFTVFNDTRGRYNERADKRSWREMETFLEQAFGREARTDAPSSTDVETVDYDDDGFSLTGYLSVPSNAETGKTPAVVIVPDWDGVSGPDGYEAGRATLLASEGYVGFAADIYGSNLTQVEDFEERRNLTTLYRTDYTLFVSRIQAAVDLVAAHELVDPEKVFLIGYCFGGTGVVDYAFADIKNVKAVVPFHGGLTSLAPIETDVVYPYVLVQSGGEDDAHGNNTELELMLNGGNATWEITRYSDVYHGFTVWGGDAYNGVADGRSWDAMLSVFKMLLDTESDGDMQLTSDGDQQDEDEDVEEDESTNGDSSKSTSGSAGMFQVMAVVFAMASTVLFM